MGSLRSNPAKNSVSAKLNSNVHPIAGRASPRKVAADASMKRSKWNSIPAASSRMSNPSIVKMVRIYNSDISSVMMYRAVDRYSYRMVERDLPPKSSSDVPRNESRTKSRSSNPHDTDRNGSVEYSPVSRLESPNSRIVSIDHKIGSSVANVDPNSPVAMSNPNSRDIEAAKSSS